MAGLLNSGVQEVQANVAPAGGELSDPILQKIEKGIEAAVPPELKAQYMKIIVAGMKVMFSKNTFKFLEQRLSQPGDISQSVSAGIADLLSLIYNESKRTMSIPAAMLAAISLMANALDYAEKSGKLKVTPEIVDKCTQATWQAATERFGITKDKIDQVVAQSQSGKQAQPEAPAAGVQQQPMTGA